MTASDPALSGKGCILVVDDDADVRRAMTRALKHNGFEVEAADGAAAALELLGRRRFEAVVTDISMPEKTGVDLLDEVRKRDGDLPVIFITGGPAIESAMRGIELGVHRYLVKPVDPTELIRILERAVLTYRMALVRRDVTRFLSVEEHEQLESNFENALRTTWMAYQPIVWSDGRLFGYEALLRGDEPTLPDPGAVLHAAEQLRRLSDVGKTSRSRAVQPFVEGVPEDAVLFVNVHAQDLMDPSLLLGEAELTSIAKRVVLEITERATLTGVRDLPARLKELRALGFRIAIDDLGAGYAGLGSFSLVEPEVVKIDMSLVRDVDKQPMKRKLIASLSQFCRDMGMLVVSEGVETVEERDALLEIGCPLLQGYLFGRPTRVPAKPKW